MAVGGGVRVLKSTEVKLPPLPQTPPPAPVKLSMFDVLWMACPPVQKLILYSRPTTNISSQSLLQHLKSSLSSTLRLFLPLAGSLVYNQSTGDVEIDLSSPAFTFIEADSDLDLHQLATDQIHDVGSYIKLVPTVDVTMLPVLAFAVQVTRFGCGGIAIGYSYIHAVVDGKGVMQFMEAWARTCKANIIEGEDGGGVLSTECCPPPFDRKVIQHPKADEIAKQFMRIMAPDLPRTRIRPVKSIEEERLVNSRQTFVLSIPSIQALKRRALHLANNTSRTPSTYAAISAYTWACYVQAKSFDPTEQTRFVIPLDCRTRLNPQIQEEYFANCLRLTTAAMQVSELISEDGLFRACTAIRKAIDDTSKDPVHGIVDSLVSFKTMSSVRFFGGTASPRFRVYEIDFGWGKPARFETVSLNEEEFALVGGKEEGTVQLSIAMHPDQIEAFAKLFLGGLNA